MTSRRHDVTIPQMIDNEVDYFGQHRLLAEVVRW
jgi:hypothetical protein